MEQSIVNDQKLIHEADPQTRPVVIIVYAHVARPSVSPHFSKQNKFQAKAMFANGETVGLAEWIIDDTCLVYFKALLVSYQCLNGYSFLHKVKEMLNYIEMFNFSFS